MQDSKNVFIEEGCNKLSFRNEEEMVWKEEPTMVTGLLLENELECSKRETKMPFGLHINKM